MVASVEILASILAHAPASTPLGRWLGVAHDAVQRIVEAAVAARFRTPIPVRGGTLRVNDTFILNDDRQRFVLLAVGEGTRTDGKVVPIGYFLPLAGDHKPSRGDFSEGMYASIAQKLRFPTPIFYGANARKQYDRYVEFMEKFGNAELIVPFESSKEKPEPPEAPPPPSDVDDPAPADVVIRHTVQDGTTAEWDQAADRGRGEAASIYHVLRRGGFVKAHRAGVYRRTNSVGLTETRAPIAWMVGELHRRGFKVHLDLSRGEASEALARRQEYLQERAAGMAERAERKADEAASRLRAAQGAADAAVERQEIPGFFPTPKDLAAKVVDYADVSADSVVLDPSAGHGALAQAVRAVAPDADMDVIEIDPRLQRLLLGQGFALVATDIFDPSFEAGTMYDRIVMNPPYEDAVSIDHVLRAWEYLAPGGRLVAVLPESIAFRTDKKHTAFRAWLEARGASNEKLPPLTFGRATVNTRVYTVDKGAGPEHAPSVSTEQRILAARAAAAEVRAESAKAEQVGRDRTYERYNELLRRQESAYRRGEEGLSKPERAELKALQMQIQAARMAERAKRIASSAGHLQAIDVSKGGRMAVYKPPTLRASQTSDDVLQGVVERFRKLKAPTGATKLERGYRSKESVATTLRWEAAGEAYTHNYTLLLGGGKSEPRSEERRRDLVRRVDVYLVPEGARVRLTGGVSYAPPVYGDRVVERDPDAIFAAVVEMVRADPQVQAAVQVMGKGKKNPTAEPVASGLFRNPTVSIHSDITPASYPGVFRDAGHGVPAVDDPWPDEPCPVGAPCPDTVEEVKLSDEVREMIKLRQGFEGLRQVMDTRLRALAPGAKVKSRTKTPFSIINKLRRKRILGPHGLTDVVGTMLVLKDQAEVDRVVEQILGGALGEVAEHEDFYTTPLDGYRAHHFIVLAPEGKLPVEVQVKTQRQAALAAGSHTPYKEGRLHAAEMGRLSELAYRADRGDVKAARAVDPLLADEAALQQRLTT